LNDWEKRESKESAGEIVFQHKICAAARPFTERVFTLSFAEKSSAAAFGSETLPFRAIIVFGNFGGDLSFWQYIEWHRNCNSLCYLFSQMSKYYFD
jgi:hypothetical protein